MRVLYSRTHYWFGLSHGGSVAHTAGVLGALARRADVTILSNEEIYGVTDIPCKIVRPIGRGRVGELLYNLRFMRPLRREIESFQPDFVYHRCNGYSFATALACKRLRAPLVLEFNSSHVWKSKHERSRRLRARLQAPLVRLVLPPIESFNLCSACLVVVVSSALEDVLVRQGFPRERILINPNGVDPERFRQTTPAERAAVKEELGVPQDKVVIGFFGTFGPWHGTPELTEAIAKVNADPKLGSQAFFVLYGGRSDLRDDMQARLRHFRNVLFTGPVEYSRIQEHLSICDVLVSPHGVPPGGQTFFRSPIKLFEYMSMARGIVASNIGQLSGLLEHKQSAYLCEPGSAENLAEGVRFFLENPEQIPRMGAKARSVILMGYTWEHNVERTLERFRELQSEGAGPV